MTTKKVTTTTATTTTTRPKYYKAIDILFYILYCCIIIGLCVLGVAFSWNEGTAEGEIYIEMFLFVLVCTMLLTFILGLSAMYTDYNVMYTMFPNYFKKSTKVK